MDMIDNLGRFGIVPVITLDSAKDAAPLAKALKAGGLPVAEITFRTEAAEASVAAIAKAEPDVLLGAGTILSEEQAKRAAGAGAKFIVSPGCNPKVIEYCLRNSIPVLPGCCTPTDIDTAMSYGLCVVKFFPAEAFGGIATIKALSAPYGSVRFMPTGGIREDSLKDYLAHPSVLACGGGWMAPGDLVRQGAFGQIEELARHTMGTVQAVRPKKQ